MGLLALQRHTLEQCSVVRAPGFERLPGVAQGQGLKQGGLSSQGLPDLVVRCVNKAPVERGQALEGVALRGQAVAGQGQGKQACGFDGR